MASDRKPTWTPGPWSVDRPFREPGVYVQASNTATVAKMYPTDSTDPGSPDANAHLIAASPALYEALEKCLAKMDEEWGRDFLPEQQAALAALRLARGE